jgi:hypothetical protein
MAIQRAERRIEAGWKMALSMRMAVVSSFTSELSPP